MNSTCKKLPALPAGRQVLNYQLSPGFTLVELLLVLGLTAIFLTVGVLNTVCYFMRQSLDVETKSIVALLHDAQSRSMGQENENRWGVYFNNEIGQTRDWYALFEVDEALLASSSYADVPGQAVERRTIKANLELTTPLEGLTQAIVFSKIAGLPSASTTISLQLTSDATSDKNVQISGNGKIDYQ